MSVLLYDTPLPFSNGSVAALGLQASLQAAGRLVTVLPRPTAVSATGVPGAPDVVVLIEAPLVTNSADRDLLRYVNAGGTLIRTEDASTTSNTAFLFAATPATRGGGGGTAALRQASLLHFTGAAPATLTRGTAAPQPIELGSILGLTPILGVTTLASLQNGVLFEPALLSMPLGSGVVLQVNDNLSLMYSAAVTNAAHELLWGNLVDYAATLSVGP